MGIICIACLGGYKNISQSAAFSRGPTGATVKHNSQGKDGSEREHWCSDERTGHQLHACPF